MIELTIGNQGRYAEGVLAVATLTLPATTEAVQAALSHIGVDGRRYEEIYIAQCETPVPGLAARIGEYESIDELNCLAALLETLDGNGGLDKFEAAVTLGEYTGSVKDLINLAQNLDCYDLYPGVTDEEKLGYYMIDEMCALKIPEEIQGYFDYEAYGRDTFLNETSEFTDRGYICNNGGSFIEHYSGRDDLPEEHRVFAYPKEKEATRSILATLKQHREAAPAAHSGKEKTAASHDER
ncbi:antirestriction protein ArdA [Bariatricus massiliensis]|uniref:Antirestriction protein ArdA n=1 Tax=Bariatricus massiliensis TaxID=1745713 RepID=A0ABS8DBF4_9FIRM|nr:antirestriction protein ArdA [Bariatricus massiliensis]MCB7303613.1 antirestriction protein ArdA [Bariatricus massiliensis]MCB7373028.1 antirestriction protein ArdA [Bariatricus massiliensis]MCB7385698.1 antirestriction protein ArdA [Bariatricus massiliensis]MCB7409861.1 antirestriction protein ArdA [Bariatricus massiliensis]MCQ5253171.1 antirestriction protein ArdA [Bariatricus massiliensis]